MAIPVLILGESGTGKTTSLRNCSPEKFGIINVSKKPLPFRSQLKTYNTDDYGKIVGALKLAKAPSMVIDDSQYLMVNALCVVPRKRDTTSTRISPILIGIW